MDQTENKNEVMQFVKQSELKLIFNNDIGDISEEKPNQWYHMLYCIVGS